MRIGVTLGDPAGIGPELVRAVCDGGDDLVVYGDAILCAGRRRRSSCPSPRSTRSCPACRRRRPAARRSPISRTPSPTRVAGRLDALVTAPIHKASCLAAGFAFPGHTEFLQARFGAPAVTMMFAGPRMRVSLATIHHALADVPRVLSAEAIAVAIVHTAEALVRDFGVEAPRIAVAGLNPHAGEQGHFGDDETRVIVPAIAVARARGSPPPASTPSCGARASPTPSFAITSTARFDAVVAMYHDQGLIPVKVVDFEEAVNVTLGLRRRRQPFVRTSPDHGVAYDIAGRKLARPDLVRRRAPPGARAHGPAPRRASMNKE